MCMPRRTKNEEFSVTGRKQAAHRSEPVRSLLISSVINWSCHQDHSIVRSSFFRKLSLHRKAIFVEAVPS